MSGAEERARAGGSGLTAVHQEAGHVARCEDFTDAKVGYAIVDAESHDAAVEMFSDHPHLGLIAGNSIEVLECPAIPA
ncbi:MAG TPA: hypothetical protein VMZ00_17275 [Sporichthya sp.]|nr:hypothetical protein [Sporichthya sp.]